MLKKLLETKTDRELARLLYKTDKQHWHWINKYYYGGRTPDAAHQCKRWKRIYHMVYDEMYSEDRVLRNT